MLPSNHSRQIAIARKSINSCTAQSPDPLWVCEERVYGDFALETNTLCFCRVVGSGNVNHVVVSKCTGLYISIGFPVGIHSENNVYPEKNPTDNLISDQFTISYSKRTFFLHSTENCCIEVL